MVILDLGICMGNLLHRFRLFIDLNVALNVLWKGFHSLCEFVDETAQKSDKSLIITTAQHLHLLHRMILKIVVFHPLLPPLLLMLPWRLLWNIDCRISSFVVKLSHSKKLFFVTVVTHFEMRRAPTQAMPFSMSIIGVASFYYRHLQKTKSCYSKGNLISS